MMTRRRCRDDLDAAGYSPEVHGYQKAFTRDESRVRCLVQEKLVDVKCLCRSRGPV